MKVFRAETASISPHMIEKLSLEEPTRATNPQASLYLRPA
jgi:hypothetical protein